MASAVKTPIYSNSDYMADPIKIHQLFDTRWNADQSMIIDPLMTRLRDKPEYYAASKESKKWWPSWEGIPPGMRELVKLNAALRWGSRPAPERPHISLEELEELKKDQKAYRKFKADAYEYIYTGGFSRLRTTTRKRRSKKTRRH